MTKPLPTLFVSHGSPTVPMEDIPAKHAWVELGRRYRDVKAVVIISPHWNSWYQRVGTTEAHETIYDFLGFEEEYPELYQIKYRSKGSPELAARIVDLIKGAGITVETDDKRGLDHGSWVPLMVMFPEANVPVVEISIQHQLKPKAHLELGRALEPLRHEGVLFIGSGGAVHPLGFGVPRPNDTEPYYWAQAFDDWLNNVLVEGDIEQLLEFGTRSRYPKWAHPYPDHLMPLIAAVGAAGEGAKGVRVHQSWYWGMVAMDCFEFAPPDELESLPPMGSGEAIR